MRSTPRRILVAAVLVVFALCVTACMPGADPLAHEAVAGHALAGFWLGLWHGVIIWVTFIVSLFDHSVSIYEVHNTGWPYDLGYAIGAATLHSGGAAASRRRWRASAPAVVVVQSAPIEP